MKICLEYLQGYRPRGRSIEWVIKRFVADVVGSSPANIFDGKAETSIGQDGEKTSQLNVEIN